MDGLGQLHSCLSAVTSDKATERRKQINILRDLVKQTHIQNSLDANNGKQDRLNWDYVVKQTIRIIDGELETLNTVKVGENIKSKDAHLRKISQIGGLFRHIIQVADSRGPQLNPRPLIRHIISKLTDGLCVYGLGTEYLDIIVRYILNQEKYLWRIGQDLFKQILECSFGLYVKDDKFKRPAAETICAVVVNSADYVDLNYSSLFKFFTKSLSSCKNQSWPVILNIIKTMNTVCEHRARENRIQIAALGEEVHDHLLWLWAKFVNKLGDSLVEFWNYQMVVHHPLGRKLPEEGAFAIDRVRWKNQLSKLYGILCTHLQNVCGRSKFESHKNSGITDSYIRLCAEVCHQLFEESSSVLEITQLVDLDSTLSTNPRIKRQRLESGWEVLRQQVCTPTVGAVAWIEILTALYHRHADSVPGDEVGRLLSGIQNGLENPKIVEVTDAYLQCLVTMVQQWKKISVNLDCFYSNQCRISWKGIVGATIRLIGLNHSEDHAYSLLTSLERSGLVEVDVTWWKCLTGSVSLSFMNYLSCLLSNHDVPVSLSQSDTQEKYPFRMQLFDWLLPDMNDKLDESGSLIGCELTSPFKMAQILVSLLFRETPGSNVEIPPPKPDPFSEIESFLLTCSFDLHTTSESYHSRGQGQGHIRRIDILVKKLETLIMRDCRFLMGIEEYTISSLYRLLDQCSLVIGCTYLLRYYDVIAQSANPSTAFADMIRALMKKIEKELIPHFNGAHASELLSRWASMYKLNDVITSRDTKPRDNESRDFIVQILVAETPNSILRKIESLCEANATDQVNPLNTTLSRPQDATRSRSLDAINFDDFDADVPDTTMNFDVESDASDVENLGTVRCLTDEQELMINSVRALCQFVKMETSQQYLTSSQQNSPDWRDKLNEVKNYLLNFIDNDHIDLSSVVGLQIVECVVKELLDRPGIPLFDDDVASILEVIRNLFKLHRKDGRICRSAVEMLTKLIPFVSDRCENNDPLQQSRQVIMHILTIIWKIQYPQDSNESMYSKKTRKSILNCIQTLVQYDPNQEWSRWSTSEILGDSSEDSLLLGLQDPSHSNRIFTAQNLVKWLFVRERVGLYPVEKDSQNKFFTKLYEALTNIMVVEGRLSVLNPRDEAVNRTSAVLHTLRSSILHSAICGKKATFVFFILMKQHNIDVDIVVKVMRNISMELGFKNLIDYFADHLGYVIDKWLNLNYPISDFPQTVFGFSSKTSFYEEYQKTVIPLLIVHEKTEDVVAIADLMKISVNELLRQNSIAILTYILPYLSSPTIDSLKFEKAQKQFDFLVQNLTKPVIENLCAENLEELIVNILLSYQNGNDVISIPESNPPSFTSALVNSSLEYLVKGKEYLVKGKNRSLIQTLAKSKNGLLDVLLALKMKVYEGSVLRIYSWHHSIVVYRFFVEKLVEDVQSLGEKWPFVLRDIVYTLVHCMKQLLTVKSALFSNVVSSCFDRCVTLLGHVIEVGLSVNDILGELLPVIVAILIDSVNQKACKISVNILNMIFCRYGERLRNAIVLLDPLPWNENRLSSWQQENENRLSSWQPEKVAEFQEKLCLFRKIQDKLKYENRQWSLEREIEHFLSSGEQCLDFSNRIEGLKSLAEILGQKKEELSQLQKQCVEAPGKAVLPRLMAGLLAMIRAGHVALKSRQKRDIDEEFIEHCCRCLGELGPLDLHVIALSESAEHDLPSEQIEHYTKLEENFSLRNCLILNRLDACLLSPSIQVASASVSSLRAVLSLPEGIQFFSQYRKDAASNSWNTKLKYLQIFCQEKRKPSARGPVNWTKLEDDSLWCPDLSHSEWIINIVCAIIESNVVQDNILNAVLPVCRVKSEFSAMILPYIIHDLLLREDETRELISQKFRCFFQQHCGIAEKESNRATTPSTEIESEDSVCADRRSVDCLLNVIHFLRTQKRPKRGRGVPTVWENNFWLDVDYLDLARAAQSCGRHFTAVLYGELWCDIQRCEDSQNSYSSSSQNSAISSLPSESRSSVVALLLESYKAIGDPDGVYGCDLTKLTDTAYRIKTYEHERRWDKALSWYDLEMSSDLPRLSTQLGVLNSLNQCGLHHVLVTYMQGRQGIINDPNLQSVQYQAALNCGKWDLEVTTNCTEKPEFYQSLYGAVCSLKDKDLNVCEEQLKRARFSCVEKLGTFHLLSSNRVYKLMSKFLITNQVEDSLKVANESLDSQSLLEKWNLQSNALIDTDYSYVEAVNDVRLSLLQLLHNNAVANIKQGLMLQILQQARLATENERYQTAAKAIRELSLLVDDSSDDGLIKYDLQIDEAKLFWARAESNIAVSMLTNAAKQTKRAMVNDTNVKKKYAEMLGIQGVWLAQTHKDSPQTIMDEYLAKSVKMFERLDNSDKACIEAHSSLARFADTQYQQIKDYIHSSVYENKTALTKKARSEVQKLSDLKSRSSDVSRYIKLLEKHAKLDEAENSSMMQDQSRYLLIAVRSHVHCLRYSSDHDLMMFRLTSLWFDNSDVRDVNQVMNEAVERILSHKFVPLLYQLAARMSDAQKQKKFQTSLMKLIRRCCIDHPHHSLPIILALAHGNLDEEFINVSDTERQGKLSNEKEDRAIAASNLLMEAKTGVRGKIIQQMEALSRAYIELANLKADKFKNSSKPVKIPANLSICKMKGLDVAVPTDSIQIDVTCEYSDVATLHSVESTFSMAGGINLPKIISCTGSDGRKRKQLVKGKDDLRQDAVMQQVFGMVNTLLKKDPEARRRNLNIRTYKIVPLSQRSGVLEWCEGTQPLGEYLIGNRGGAHARYRPDDWPAIQCRNIIKESSTKSTEERLEAYMEICRNFKPVLRHFFLEKFGDPATWYERRVAYTRSVATNSIVGYIVGLGDRHVQNILIDTESAELVHIDLGVAFEQGKILPTPETVPFRLTRDIVDGMGVTGVEGIFRRSCEKTIQVMRDSYEVLLTIVEVLLYDPLYCWSMSPLKAYLIQHRKDRQEEERDLNTTSIIEESEEDSNKPAERVLLRLKQKLLGQELGMSMAASGQVNMLIQEAMDPNNLCRLFSGWQPYL